MLCFVVRAIRNVESRFLIEVFPGDLGIYSGKHVHLGAKYVAVYILNVKFVCSAIGKLHFGRVLSFYENAVSLNVKILYLRRLSVASELYLYVFDLLDLTIKHTGIYIQLHSVAVTRSVCNYHIVVSVGNINGRLLQVGHPIYRVKLFGGIIQGNVGIFVVFA